IEMLRLVLSIDILQTARFEILRGKIQRRLLRFRASFVKQRQRARKILLSKQDLRDAVGGGSGELAVAVVVEHALETRARRGSFIQRPITFGQIKISARTARRARVLAQEFLVFRCGEIVKLAGKKPV